MWDLARHMHGPRRVLLPPHEVPVNAPRTLTSPLALLLLGASLAVGCGGSDEPAPKTGDENDLTSLTARERNLEFESFVYVAANASDSTIQQAIKRSNKSGLGALRTAQISVNTRELSDIDMATVVKEPVSIVDPADADAPGTPALRVRYKYTDRALVPVSMAKRTAASLGLLHGNYQSQSERILTECTENTSHDREFASDLWYVFNPSLSECRDAIDAEQTAIDQARAGLSDAKDKIVQAEFDRLYIPLTVKLESAATSKGTTYPEYDKLWRGGQKPGRLVVSIVSGVMADWAAGEKPELADDIGYKMFYQQMAQIEKVYPTLELAKTEGTDLTTFTAAGKTVNNVTWKDLESWANGSGLPSQFSSYSDREALRKEVANKLARHWLTFEQPVKVKIGKEAATDVVIEINTYYGAETSDAPHRRAMQTSDVVVYNGHSYIGWGPLDPGRYSENDFPDSYQIFFFNSCISFNYYEKDFFEMHPGGTASLDMVTNGLESPVYASGPSVGAFVAGLIDGKQKSYKSLLTAAAKAGISTEVGVDAMRVVDGEVDNTYKPSKTKITVTAQ